MKNKWKNNPFLHTAIILTPLFIILTASAIGIFYYVFTIPEPEGLSLASWPETFTGDFSTWIEEEEGRIILKNAEHMEQLMDDLKLTYQLEAGALPCTPQEIRIVRFLKELVIDIANDPVFSKQTIEFESSIQEMTLMADPGLLRRAVGNLVINALVHNPMDTKVKISVAQLSDHSIAISIQDNGSGMSATEMSDLWNRYYRGTNTKERVEGSGLGLAIAKQIITLHSGDISVKSSLGAGTEFKILLPLGTEEN